MQWKNRRKISDLKQISDHRQISSLKQISDHRQISDRKQISGQRQISGLIRAFLLFLLYSVMLGKLKFRNDRN